MTPDTTAQRDLERIAALGDLDAVPVETLTAAGRYASRHRDDLRRLLERIAAELYRKGLIWSAIAAALEVSTMTAYRWGQRAERRGEQ